MNFQKSFHKITIEDVDNLKELHKLQDIKTFKISFGGDFIAVFVQNSGEEALKNNWRRINSSLSQYLDDSLDDDFSKWNLYVMYLINGTVSKELQYEIENNTFASRKIVEDNYDKELTNENIQALIASHIEFSDFNVKNNEPTKPTEYASNSIVWEKISNFGDLNEKNIDEILHSIEEAIK
ncbi:ABC-three component system middle component 1 [Sulfurovum sp.]|uniref:ABC-three component system middle component 1 n=1 Tax=Sulfurovum sp. TaxID=1969726 RepID=UPI0035641679